MVSVGFDPTRYNVLEGDSTDLVIRKMGDAEGSVVASVSTSDITAIGIIKPHSEHIIFRPR